MSSPASGNEGALAGLLDAAATENERRIGWLRLPAVALAAAAQGLGDGDGSALGFAVALAVALAYAAGALLWVYTRPVTPRFSVAATVCDVVAITLIVGLSGGALSEARWAFFFVPIVVTFRFQPALTAGAGAATVVAFVVQAAAQAAADGGDAAPTIVLHAAYLTWLTVAATLLSFVLRRRTERVGELLSARQRLMADAVTAEEREREALAEGLHNVAIQNLLSARHDLEEVAGTSSHPSLERVDAALQATIAALRQAIFELHPSVLEQAGLAPALRTLGEQAARRGRFRLQLDVEYEGTHPHERLLLGVARELLANAAQHADADNVVVALRRDGHELVLTVSDDGRGLDRRVLAGRVAEGHIGLSSQRERVESIGGRMAIESTSGRGTTVEVRLPA